MVYIGSEWSTLIDYNVFDVCKYFFKYKDMLNEIALLV